MQKEEFLNDFNLDINKRSFWLDHLNGGNVKVEFVNDINNSNTTNNGYKDFYHVFKEETSALILRTSNNSDYILFTVFLSTLLVMIYRYNGCENIIIDTVANNESVNYPLLLIKSNINRLASFRKTLKKEISIVSDCFKHQNFFYDSLVSSLDISTIEDLYDIGIVLTNIQKKANINITKNSILFSFTRSSNEIQLDITYNSNKYKYETVEQIAKQYEFITYKLLNEPNVSITDINIISKEDKDKIFNVFNGHINERIYDVSICKYLESNAINNPNKVAFIDNESSITYRHLNDKVNQISDLLRKNGINRNVLVAVLCHRSIEMVISVLGIIKSGGIYLPLDPSNPTRRLEDILIDSDAKYLLTDISLVKENEQKYFELISNTNIECIIIQGNYNHCSFYNALFQSAKLNRMINQGMFYQAMQNDIFAYNGCIITYKEMCQKAHKLIQEIKKRCGNNKVKVMIFANDLYIKALCFTVVNELNLEYFLIDVEKNKNNVSKLLTQTDINVLIVQNSIVNIVDEILCTSGQSTNYITVDNNNKIKVKDDFNDSYITDVINTLADDKMDEVNKNINSKRDFYIASDIKKSHRDIKYMNKLFTVVTLNDAYKNLPYQTEIVNKEDDLCYIIYTSGSTGKPKGALIQHKGMMNHILCKVEDLNLNSKSRIVQNASQCFDISIWQFFTAIVVGGTCYIYNDDNIHNVVKFMTDIVKDEISVLEVVPSYLNAMLDVLAIQKINFEKLQYIVVTGEEVKTELINRWFDKYKDITIVNGYGPTEASDDITHYFINSKLDCIRVPVGKPLRNLRIYIVDNNMYLCPIDYVGEIVVSGIGVGKGYLNNAEKTNEVFCKDPFYGDDRIMMYKTGDLGRYKADGNIEYFGRKDEQVKIRGFRIEVQEIESKITNIVGVLQSVVISRSDKNNMKYLCAYFVSNEVSEEMVRGYLTDVLPVYMVPQYIVRLGSMPLSSNGKINKKELPEPFVNKVKEEARNDFERNVINMWAKIVDIVDIGIDDDFFTIGGHSLKAAIFLSRFNKEYNSDITLAEFFKVATVREFGEFAKNRINMTQYMEISTAAKKDYYRLSPHQLRMYIIQKHASSSIMYNIPMFFKVDELLDEQKIENIFYKLILRHESLRTKFLTINGEIYQRIEDDVNFFVSYHYLAGNDKDSIDKIISSFIEAFELETSPLFRVGIIDIGHTKGILMVDFHHIIFDAESQIILIKEFIELYEDENLELPDLKIQYKDYSEWLYNDQIIRQRNKQESYWLSRLENINTEINLPITYQRNETTGFCGKKYEFTFSVYQVEMIYNFAKTNSITVFMLIMAALDLCLSEICNQSDITVGTVTAGRNHHMLKDLIGMFVNTLAIYNRVENGISYRKFIENVKDNVLKDFDNQDYPFEELVSKLHLQSKSDRNPLFDVMLVFQNTNFMLNNIRQVDTKNKFSEYSINNNVSKFDLSLIVEEINNNLKFRFEYKSGLFDEQTIERIIHCFKEKLLDIIERTDNLIDILMN